MNIFARMKAHLPAWQRRYWNKLATDIINALGIEVSRFRYRICDNLTGHETDESGLDCAVANGNWGTNCTCGEYTACDEFKQTCLSVEKLNQDLSLETAVGQALDALVQDEMGVIKRGPGEPDHSYRSRGFNTPLQVRELGTRAGIWHDLGFIAFIEPMVGLAREGVYGWILGESYLGVGGASDSTWLSTPFDIHLFIWASPICRYFLDPEDGDPDSCVVSNANFGVACTDGTYTACDEYYGDVETRIQERLTDILPRFAGATVEFCYHYVAQSTSAEFNAGTVPAGMSADEVDGALIVLAAGEGSEQVFDSDTMDLGADYDDWVWFCDWVCAIRERPDADVFDDEGAVSLGTAQMQVYIRGSDTGLPGSFTDWTEKTKSETAEISSTLYRYYEFRLVVLSPRTEDFTFLQLTFKALTPDQAGLLATTL
ncbi:MAG TPA: hypothetical protein VNA25_02485 [Phycisphaerae bacterium]|nr:hypothetical protein [Phycisphaerae bacterium]